MNQTREGSYLAPGACPVPGAPMPRYRGSIDAFRTIVRCEGWGALLKGWIPNFSRQGPQTVIMMFVAERLRSLLDMPPV